eukprot:COSAG01_NODE_1217_length_11190_cov_69.180417_10_plen_58_part_00
MSRRGCILPANASSFGPHRVSISSRFGQVFRILSIRLLEPLVTTHHTIADDAVIATD